MGTRSLTFVFSEKSTIPMMCMCNQFDGYPNGYGADLAKFLDIVIIDGISDDAQMGIHANGMGCLAAQLVAHFKTRVGGIYLAEPDLNQDSGQEYEYHVFDDRVVVYSNIQDILRIGMTRNCIFSGTWKHFKEEVNDLEKIDSASSLSGITSSLHAILREGVAIVTFKKADKTTRVMRCTTNPDYLPYFYEGARVSTDDPKLYIVWDVDKKGWRSFRKERIIKYEAENVYYMKMLGDAMMKEIV